MNLRRGDLRIEDRGAAAFVVSAFLHYGVRALLRRPVTRDKQFVIDEYNHQRDEFWKPSLTYNEYVYGNTAVSKWTLIDFKSVFTPECHVRSRLLPLLRDRVAKYSKPGELVVEFGAGTGRNLAYLAHELPDRKYLGLELTPRSVEDARKQLDSLGLPVEMRVADITQPSGVSGAVAYSVLALEQLPNSVSREALRQMAATATAAVVCFEPIRELYPMSLRGFASRLRQYRADYLKNLPRHAEELGLRIESLARTGLGNNALNEICELLIETTR
jgi:protein-L-isoaspartate O-methyltransferase